MKPHLLITLVLGLLLSACDAAPVDETHQEVKQPSAVEQQITPPEEIDEKTFTRHKKTIDYFLQSAPYLALVKTNNIKRTSIWADEIGQMQDLGVRADVLETFRGDAAKTITYKWTIEMGPLTDITKADTTSQIISLCYSNGKYIAQEVAFSAEAYPELIKYAREQSKAKPNENRIYSSCPVASQ